MAQTVTEQNAPRFGKEYAARKSEAVKRWQGVSGTRKPHVDDVDPLDPGGNNYTIPDGSTFTEADTGLVWVWKNYKWNAYVAQDRALEVQEQILAELVKLREHIETRDEIVFK